MAKAKLDHGTWVLVCDGAKALFFENVGDAHDPKLETREVAEQPDLKDREMKQAPPGRVFASAGGRRGAVEETDFHDRSEREFLRQVSRKLDAQIGARHIRHLIVAAPSRALGMLRGELSPAARNVISAEIDKDYVKMPAYEIEKHLTKALAG